MPGQEPSVGEIQADAEKEYLAYLSAAIARQQRYPKRSRQRGEEGICKIAIEIASDGRLLAAKVSVGSGYVRLDREAMKMVRRAAPFPALPAHMQGQNLRIQLPVSFRLEAG